MDKLKKMIKDWSMKGMHWPFVHDPTSQQPSVTLMFFYMSYMTCLAVVMASSIMMILKGDYLSSTFAPIFMFVLGFVFYRLRKLDTFKIDLDDKSIEFSSDDESEPAKSDEEPKE